MEANPDSQGDESNYHDQASYYDSINGSMRDHDVDYQGGDLEQRSPLREQDRFLPIANVAKIMKRAVPNNGKIAKDAKECVQECVSEFISFITSEAAERCQAEKRKTINGEDILCAMNVLGFDNYVEPLKTFLVKYREISKLESTYMDDSGASGGALMVPSTATPPSCSITPATPGNTVILTPANLLSGAGVTSTPTVLCSRQQQQQQQQTQQHFTVVNGSGSGAGGTVTTAGTEIKLPAGTSLATLGSGLPSAIILPISTQLTVVNGIPTTTVSTSDPATNNVS